MLSVKLYNLLYILETVIEERYANCLKAFNLICPFGPSEISSIYSASNICNPSGSFSYIIVLAI